MRKIWLDNETRSRTDLPSAGVYRYVEDPDFAILMCAWTVDKVNYHIAIGEDEVRRIPGLFDDDVIKVAANSTFERVTFSRLKGLPTGTYLPPEAFDDPMVRASENGYPAKLEKAAKALGTTEKDSAGTRLINLFSKPVSAGKRKGEFNNAETHPEQWQEFVDYCIQDVRTLVEIDDALPDWPIGEYEKWIVDQRVNDTGIPIDVLMCERAFAAGQVNAERAWKQMAVLAPDIQNPNSVQQVQKWLHSQGVELPNLQAETVERALEDGELPPRVVSVLELRQEIALVAAKKYEAALRSVCADNRLRGGFKFYGAHTGRWSGKGVQPHNMPNAKIKCSCKTCEENPKHDAAFQHVEQQIQAGVMDVKLGYEMTPQQLKELVRAMFVGPFTVVDYAAIEARVIAWLAGEEWALQAFRDGRDIYVETAERMGGLTRKEGKVAVLALGYAGGELALRKMGAKGTKGQMMFLRDQWRGANPSIVKLWKAIEEAFWFGDLPAGKHLYIEKHGADRHVRLPSGRTLIYHGIRKQRVKVNDDGETKVAITFADPKGWRTPTYGGRLTENITQAVARDILAEALVKLHQANYEVALHVHDEIGVLGAYPLEEIKAIMVDQPVWAAGLPIDGEGFVCERYRKD